MISLIDNFSQDFLELALTLEIHALIPNIFTLHTKPVKRVKKLSTISNPQVITHTCLIAFLSFCFCLRNFIWLFHPQASGNVCTNIAWKQMKSFRTIFSPLSSRVNLFASLENEFEFKINLNLFKQTFRDFVGQIE